MKKLLSLVAAILFAVTTFAQVDEITLTVIGTGVNEEKATLQALRSAIEQSFGAFVSANTTILNDKLVQDEIVSVSNGNIKEYKKLAVATMPNGHVSVSVKATVSINKLISYAKSKGSRAEFAGQAFSSNLKVMKLRVESTKKALNLLMQQLDNLSRDMFDFKIVLGDPVKEKDTYYFYPHIEVYSNVASMNFYNLLCSTLDALQLSPNDVKFCRNSGIPCSKRMANPGTCRIYVLDKDNEYKYFDLPLSAEECEDYNQRLFNILNKAYTHFSIVEIGNPRNVYKCIPVEDVLHYRKIPEYHFSEYFPYHAAYISGPKISSTTYERRLYYRHGYVHDYHRSLDDNLKSVNIHYCMTEVRTPIKLTKQQKKEVKKGIYKGATYTTEYKNPHLLMVFLTELPAYNLEQGNFQGFEVKTK